MYGSIQKYWSELNVVTELNPGILRNQVIWNNRYITMENKSFEWKKWMESGIITVNDILGDNGVCLNHNEINIKFNVKGNFLNALQIRQSIPIKWRETLENSKSCTISNECYVVVNNKALPLVKTPSKTIYLKFVNRRRRSPTCIGKWTEEYPKFETASPELWQNIFKLPYIVVRETKLQSFYYRIVHRIITCNKKLYNMKLVPSPRCSYCDETDTLRHFFLLCDKVKHFWDSFFKWWNRLGDLQVCDVPEECVLFGYQWETDDIFKVLNFCILNAKFYIHKQKLLNNNNIDLYDFLIILRYKLQLEKVVCENKEMNKEFEKYQFIYEQL